MTMHVLIGEQTQLNTVMINLVLPSLWLTRRDSITTYNLGPVYIMDDEVVPRRSKSIDWLLNSSHDNFGLHYWKNGRGIMEVEGPKYIILKA